LQPRATIPAQRMTRVVTTRERLQAPACTYACNPDLVFMRCIVVFTNEI